MSSPRRWLIMTIFIGLLVALVAMGGLYVLTRPPLLTTLAPKPQWRVKWQTTLGSTAALTRTLALGNFIDDGDDLLAMTLSGELYRLRVADGHATFVYEFEPTITPPIREGNFLFVAGEYLTAFDLKANHVSWQIPLQGGSVFAPGAANGRLILHQQLRPDIGLLTAYNTTDGKTIWSKTTSFGSSTPIVVGDKLYFAADKVYALDASDSAILWRSQPLLVAGALAFSDKAIIAGTLVDRGRTVVALDPTEGAQRWESKLVMSPINGKPLVDAKSNNVIVTSNDGTVYALKLDDGTLRWQFKADSRVRAELIAVDNQLLFNSENGTLYSLDLQHGTVRATFQAAGGQGRTLVAPRVTPHLIVSASGNILYALETE